MGYEILKSGGERRGWIDDAERSLILQRIKLAKISVEESEDLTTDVSLSTLLVVHDTLVGGEDDVSELSGWEDLVDELLEVLQLQVESWGDDTALVESSVQIDDNLSISGIIDDLKSVDISVLLHDTKELNDDL